LLRDGGAEDRGRWCCSIFAGGEGFRPSVLRFSFRKRENLPAADGKGGGRGRRWVAELDTTIDGLEGWLGSSLGLQVQRGCCCRRTTGRRSWCYGEEQAETLTALAAFSLTLALSRFLPLFLRRIESHAQRRLGTSHCSTL